MIYRHFTRDIQAELSISDSKIATILKPKLDKFDGSKIYIATADISDNLITNTSTLITFKKRPSRASMQPISNSLWFAKMKNSRKLIFINEKNVISFSNMIFSTGFYGIKPKKEYFYLLWSFIKSEEFDTIKNNLCNGTTMEAINADGLSKILVPDYSKVDVSPFNNLVTPIFNKIQYNMNENFKLSELRDSLLPKLMSGEIDVSDVDI